MPYYARRHQIEGNLIYHVMNRANRRLEIFHEGEDYLYFKKILRRYVQKSGLMIYHYCIMPNHYHLEIELEDSMRISGIFAGINRAYTYYYHKKYGTAGYLWQGRFKAKPIQKEAHLLHCGKYIENNPVRAKMRSAADEYIHSSAKYYTQGVKDDIIIENPLYEEFGVTPREKRYNYREYLAEDNAAEVGIFTASDQPVGDKGFMAGLIRTNGKYHPRKQGRVRN